MKKPSEVYKHLYHYTTWDGLHGILQSQSMWGTHCKFLNDYSEIVLFKDKLIEFLQPHVSGVYEKLFNEIPKGKDRKSTRLNSSHIQKSRMPSSA